MENAAQMMFRTFLKQTHQRQHEIQQCQFGQLAACFAMAMFLATTKTAHHYIVS
jgi:hypothetical protein